MRPLVQLETRCPSSLIPGITIQVFQSDSIVRIPKPYLRELVLEIHAVILRIFSFYRDGVPYSRVHHDDAKMDLKLQSKCGRASERDREVRCQRRCAVRLSGHTTSSLSVVTVTVTVILTSFLHQILVTFMHLHPSAIPQRRSQVLSDT